MTNEDLILILRKARNDYREMPGMIPMCTLLGFAADAIQELLEEIDQ